MQLTSDKDRALLTPRLWILQPSGSVGPPEQGNVMARAEKDQPGVLPDLLKPPILVIACYGCLVFAGSRVSRTISSEAALHRLWAGEGGL